MCIFLHRFKDELLIRLLKKTSRNWTHSFIIMYFYIVLSLMRHLPFAPCSRWTPFHWSLHGWWRVHTPPQETLWHVVAWITCALSTTWRQKTAILSAFVSWLTIQVQTLEWGYIYSIYLIEKLQCRSLDLQLYPIWVQFCVYVVCRVFRIWGRHQMNLFVSYSHVR